MVENRGHEGSGAYHQGAAHLAKPRRLLKPLFHVAACDAMITSIECGPPNSGVMAFGLSSGEVYICRAPSSEVGGGVARDSGRASIDWELTPVRIGTMSSAVTQLAWATPRVNSTTRSVLHLVCCCPGRGVKVFSNDPFSRPTGKETTDAARRGWVEETVEVEDCVAVAWSSSSPLSPSSSAGHANNPLMLQNELSLICVSGKQKIVCCHRRDDGYGAWVEAHSFSGVGTTSGGGAHALQAAAIDASAGSSAPKQQAPKRSSSSMSRDVSCIAVSCDACAAGAPAGNMLAVGDYDGWVRVFEAPSLQGFARSGATASGSAPTAGGNGSGPLILLQLSHSVLVSLANGAGGTTSSTTPQPLSPCHGVRHVAWAAAQGRSFAPLGYVAGTELVVLLIANALCNLLDNTIAVGTVLGYRRVVLDEEVFKMTWNPSGTRITTSHADGTVRVYCLATTYRDPRRARASSSAAMPVLLHQDGQPQPRSTDSLHFPMVEKYFVGIDEMSRSVAPYAADPLANLRDMAS